MVQDIIQNIQGEIDFSLFDIKWREKTDRFKTAPDNQQALLEGSRDNPISGSVRCHRNRIHEAQPAHVMHELVLRLKVSQSVQEILPHFCRVLQEILFLNNLYGLIAYGRADGVSLAPGRRDSLFFLREYLFSAQRGADPQCLGRRDDIRPNIEVLTGPPLPSPAETTLYLIADEGNPVVPGNLPDLPDKIRLW